MVYNLLIKKYPGKGINVSEILVAHSENLAMLNFLKAKRYIPDIKYLEKLGSYSVRDVSGILGGERALPATHYEAYITVIWKVVKDTMNFAIHQSIGLTKTDSKICQGDYRSYYLQ